MRLIFLYPRYWLTWMGLSSIRSIAILPYGAQRHVGSALGYLLLRLPLSTRRVAHGNIDLCMSHLPVADRTRLLADYFQSLGMSLCEVANACWSHDRRMQRLAEVTGLHHLHAALAKGRGAILIGGNFTTVAVAARALGSVVPLNVVYTPPSNRLLLLMINQRLGRHARLIGHDDMGTVGMALRRNEAVFYAPDHHHGSDGAVMVDFFGIPAATSTATSRLARLSGAPVLTYFPERLPGVAGYRLVIGSALVHFPSDDATADAARFNTLLEAQILKIPEQYQWAVRRLEHSGPSSARQGETPAIAAEPSTSRSLHH
jgi:KDO2-lipid IV(A) lauroyltransferase